MKKCLIISNPYSGSSIKIDHMDSFISKLISYGYDPIFLKTEFKNHAYEIAKNIENVDLILSDGGDGTLHEVVCGNIARKEPVLQAHIPTGTTNDVGNMYGYSKDPLKCIDEVMNGEEKSVDFFGINNEPFVYVAGMGQFLHIPYTTTKEQKDKYGHLAYLKDGVKAWMEGTKNYEITYEIDGKVYDGKAAMILASNSTRIAGFSGFYEKGMVKLNDNLIEIVLADVDKKLQLVNCATTMLIKDITKAKGVTFFQTDNFKIKFNETLLHNPCVDGEEFISNTNEYSIGKVKQLKMLLPTKNIDKLFNK